MMSVKNSLFGFLSGLMTTSCSLPPAISMGIALYFSWEPKNAILFYIFLTLTTKVIGDWLFWRAVLPKELDSQKTNKEPVILGKFFSKPDAIKALSDIFIDFITDAVLIYLALKASVSPSWLFFTFLCCQVIGAPIQGIIADSFSKKTYRIFSMIVTALSVFGILEITGVIPGDYYSAVFRLTSWNIPIQLLIVLSLKFLFAGTSVIAKATLAETIQEELTEQTLRA